MILQVNLFLILIIFLFLLFCIGLDLSLILVLVLECWLLILIFFCLHLCFLFSFISVHPYTFLILPLLLFSHLSGEYHGSDTGGGHHYLHRQEKVHHVGYGHQSCRTGLWTHEVKTTGRRHFSSFLISFIPDRPWSSWAHQKKKKGLKILDCISRF